MLQAVCDALAAAQREWDSLDSRSRTDRERYAAYEAKIQVYQTQLTKTKNNLIFIEQDQPLSREEVEGKLAVLKEAVKNNEGKIASEEITAAMKSVVPTFHSPDEVNRTAQESDEMKLANK
jgi:hypothetical protein